MDSATAVGELQSLANDVNVTWRDVQRSWRKYLEAFPAGRIDEVQLIQPRVFPEFALRMLDFEVGTTLAAEQSESASRPDFTPLDLVTHPFVFEAKGSSDDLSGHDAQIKNHLKAAHGHIKHVVLINMAMIRVGHLDALQDVVLWEPTINLRGLVLAGSAATLLPDADRLADFVDRFKRRELTTDEKVARIRTAPAWDPNFEITNPSWLTTRIAAAVDAIAADVAKQIADGALDPSNGIVGAGDMALIVEEIRELFKRLGMEGSDQAELSSFLNASLTSAHGKALRQFETQVAYAYVSKVVLSRVWEDLGIVTPANLYDGQFDLRMNALGDNVLSVLAHAFDQAAEHYRPLFRGSPTHSWFRPTRAAAVEALYQLANAYFGSVTSDVLGAVYERLLERLDRRLLGQYYTPRDIISMMWDMVLTDDLIETAEQAGRLPIVLDIATGSGGFLVEGAKRYISRLANLRAMGADIDTTRWVANVTTALNGVEYQSFSAHLAEINMLIQLSILLASAPHRLPELGVINADTLSLHEPHQGTTDDAPSGSIPSTGQINPRFERLRNPDSADALTVDIAIGNPPYIGEKIGASLMQRTRREFPYWEQFVAPHLDYLYWFLILGISKLRSGGRFSFITTEYWLRSGGATKLRGYIARNCTVERIVVFRDMRLFPDAPGQHNMIVVGTRTTNKDGTNPPPATNPSVTIYGGPNLTIDERREVLANMSSGKRAGTVMHRTSLVSPNDLGGKSWEPLLLSRAQLDRRLALTQRPQLDGLRIEEGVIPTIVKVKADAAEFLPAPDVELNAGVQQLEASEVDALQPLTATERAVIRARANTADVYPYAVVVPDSAESIVYLPRPRRSAGGGDARQAPFPPGLLRIEQHLKRYRPYLEAKVAGYGENRPWWSLHRAREESLDRQPIDSQWADYCLTTRWGGGGRLVVGLAPIGAVPASGLHVLSLGRHLGFAAFVAGVLNSTISQELADTLPPGHLRAGDIANLGLVDLGADGIGEVSDLAIQLATLVSTIVTQHGAVFPLVPTALRDDVSLRSTPFNVWTPTTGVTGKVSNMPWVSTITQRGNTRKPIHRYQVGEIGQLEMTLDLIHETAHVEAQATLHLAAGTTEEQATALGAFLSGKPTIAQALEAQVPLSREGLRRSFERDVQAMSGLASEYRSLRAAIDAAIG